MKSAHDAFHLFVSHDISRSSKDRHYLPYSPSYIPYPICCRVSHHADHYIMCISLICPPGC